MTTAQKIKMAATYKNISIAELARRLNTTPQAFSQRLKTDKFTTEELKEIADVLGGKYSVAFIFPDGTKI